MTANDTRNLDRSEPTSGRLFTNTIARVEQALTAEHVATSPVITCSAKDDAGAFLGKHPTLDYFPVVQKDEVIGVFSRRRTPPPGKVEQAMERLSASMLVATETPLSDVIGAFDRGRAFLLVLGSGKIDGIITLADLHKLPVYVFVYAQTTHLESLLAARVPRSMNDDDLLSMLRGQRREALRDRLADLRGRKQDIALRHLLGFGEFLVVLRNIGRLKPRDVDELDEVRELRNDVSHAADLGAIEGTFFKRMRICRDWIRKLSEEPGQ